MSDKGAAVNFRKKFVDLLHHKFWHLELDTTICFLFGETKCLSHDRKLVHNICVCCFHVYDYTHTNDWWQLEKYLDRDGGGFDEREVDEVVEFGSFHVEICLAICVHLPGV